MGRDLLADNDIDQSAEAGLAVARCRITEFVKRGAEIVVPRRDLIQGVADELRRHAV